MKANYTRDKASIRTLILTLTKLNILTYAEFFSVKARAAGNFAVGIEKLCGEYMNDYAGYGHDLALAKSLEKAGIKVNTKGLTMYPVYRTNRDRIVFYLNLTAKELLKKRKTKAKVIEYMTVFVKRLLECQWTNGKNRALLDSMLREKVNIEVVDGHREVHNEL